MDYRQQLNNEALAASVLRSAFDAAVAGPFDVEQSRGVSVFVGFADFVQEQEGRDGKEALFAAYLEQVAAFAHGDRDPTPLVHAFGARTEDIRALAYKAYTKCRRIIEVSRCQARLLAALAMSSRPPVPVEPLSIVQHPFRLSSSDPRMPRRGGIIKKRR